MYPLDSWSRCSFCFCRKFVCGVLTLLPELTIESWRLLRLCESGELACELMGDISMDDGTVASAIVIDFCVKLDKIFSFHCSFFTSQYNPSDINCLL